MDWGSIFSNAAGAAVGLDTVIYALAALGLNIQFGYAGLLNFGLVVTATVRSQGELDEAEAIIENLGTSARIRLEEAYGAQDSTFAAGLPLGVVIPDHLALPSTVRNAL